MSSLTATPNNKTEPVVTSAEKNPDYSKLSNVENTGDENVTTSSSPLQVVTSASSTSSNDTLPFRKSDKEDCNTSAETLADMKEVTSTSSSMNSADTSSTEKSVDVSSKNSEVSKTTITSTAFSKPPGKVSSNGFCSENPLQNNKITPSSRVDKLNNNNNNNSSINNNNLKNRNRPTKKASSPSSSSATVNSLTSSNSTCGWCSESKTVLKYVLPTMNGDKEFCTEACITEFRKALKKGSCNQCGNVVRPNVAPNREFCSTFCMNKVHSTNGKNSKRAFFCYCVVRCNSEFFSFAGSDGVSSTTNGNDTGKHDNSTNNHHGARSFQYETFIVFNWDDYLAVSFQFFYS